MNDCFVRRKLGFFGIVVILDLRNTGRIHKQHVESFIEQGYIEPNGKQLTEKGKVLREKIEKALEAVTEPVATWG